MDKFEDLVPAERAQRASRRTIPASMLRDVCCALRARRQRPRRRRAAEKGNELAAATHSITSSAWDEAGRHFGRAAEQVQTRAAAISEAWSAEFLSRDVQHQPLTLSLARRDWPVPFFRTQCYGLSLAWCCLRRLRLFNFRPAQIKECPHDNRNHWSFRASRIGGSICLDLSDKN